MATVATWLEGFAPDVSATVRRFPLAIVLAALGSAAALGALNAADWLGYEAWLRLFVGFACAATCAVAGVFVAETRPAAKWLGLFALYVVPVVVAALAQVRDFGWVAPPLFLPAIAVLWLSVSPVTVIGRGEARAEQQDRFWWMNNQALATALVAGLAVAIIGIGIVAIERSLSYLFGIQTSDVFYRWVLPVTALFLAPVYWLSTLPRASDYDPSRLEKLEIVNRAVGFLGQFVLVPLLLIYAAILFVYTAQIVVTQTLPQGMIGWMVLGFVVTGAGAWLALHPAFMRTRRLVRVFRRSWFWLTVIPLILFFIAVWVRVDAYGLTDGRVLLIAGGVWGAVLAALYLVGLGDIRLIPGLAAVILLALTAGPWNYTALPNHDQAARFGRLLSLSDPTLSVAAPVWDEAQVRQAANHAYYLFRSPHGRDVLQRVLLDHGIVFETEEGGGYALMEALGYPQVVNPERSEFVYARRSPGVAVDVSATPYHLGRYEAYFYALKEEGFSLTIDGGVLLANQDGEPIARVELTEWVSRQTADAELVEPWVDFSAGGTNYRLSLWTATWKDDPEVEGEVREASNLTGELFADRPQPIPTPTP